MKVLVSHLLLLYIFGAPRNSIGNKIPAFNDIYVVPFPTFLMGNSDGSLLRPYSSIQQALDHIERDYFKDDNIICTTTINLYPTYYFVDTIRLTQVHSHTRLTTMSMMQSNFYEDNAIEILPYQRLSKAVISGGIPITNWTQLGNNTYSTVLPSLSYVNQLFINNQRIVRTRVPTNYSEYLQYAVPLNDSVMGRYGFQYVPGQFDYKSLVDAMVVIYHSWTESHHYIDHLIPENNTVIFSNPSNRPIGSPMFTIQSQRRFHIENLCEALVPNSFCFVNDTKTVYLMTNGSYNPNEVQVITPINENVLTLDSGDVYNPVKDVIINNVAIQHSAWHIDRNQEADAYGATFLRSATVLLANASSILMTSTEISHTGAYALWINTGTFDITLIDSLITDMAAGGIWIGHVKVPAFEPTSLAKIISSEISYGGNVFPSGIGIFVNVADNAQIIGNKIHHHRYNGINLGSSMGYGPSQTKRTLLLSNYVYDIGQHILCDQGGIGMGGVMPGTLIHGNVVKNVFSYATYMWGIYLDEGSSGITVSNNVVYNTGWASLFQHYGAINTIINNVFARASLHTPLQALGHDPDGDVHIQLAENHTSWTFTRNIIYDTFQGINHTAYRANVNVTAWFNNNVYFNPYGTPLLFGSGQVPFIDWQKTGQDNNSVIADPLFTGDVNQCDFFTVRSDSPAAKLGFVNITKPSLWTPGCDTEDVVGSPPILSLVVSIRINVELHQTAFFFNKNLSSMFDCISNFLHKNDAVFSNHYSICAFNTEL